MPCRIAMRTNRGFLFQLLLSAALFAPLMGEESAAAANSSPDPDGGWPRIISSESGSKMRVYQPQVEDWKDQQLLSAWTAVEYLASGRTKSDMGVVKWEANTSVAISERLVKFDNIKMTQISFPTLDQNHSREVTSGLKDLFPKEGLVISLDRVLASIDKSKIRTAGAEINQEPPPIFYARRPALLIQFDGEPIMSPIKDSELKYIVNTNWDIIQDPTKGAYYMRYEIGRASCRERV